MLYNNNHNLSKDKLLNEINLSKSSKKSNNRTLASTDPHTIAGSLKLTDELISDGIVFSFYFYDRKNHLEIVLILNGPYYKMKFVFLTGKGWDLLIKSAWIQLEQRRIKYNHILHILDTIDSNYELLLNYQLEKCMLDSFTLNDRLLDGRAVSKSFKFLNQYSTTEPDFLLIKEYIIDLIARNYTFPKNNKIYNTILDQHDKKINPIILTSECTSESERVKRIIDKYDISTQQIIFRKIILDEYERDLDDYRLEIVWGVDDGF